ncbi:MAG: arsenate reductase (glutaredoxin) [Rhodospirillales bacterium]
MTVTIYHNPRCSKSRATLALLEEKGIEPDIVKYLETPLSADDIKRILGLLGMTPRQLLRNKEADQAGLGDASLSDQELIEGMAANPMVIERPIVVAGSKAALGRPPEKVLEIL